MSSNYKQRIYEGIMIALLLGCSYHMGILDLIIFQILLVAIGWYFLNNYYLSRQYKFNFKDEKEELATPESNTPPNLELDVALDNTKNILAGFHTTLDDSISKIGNYLIDNTLTNINNFKFTIINNTITYETTFHYGDSLKLNIWPDLNTQKIVTSNYKFVYDTYVHGKLKEILENKYREHVIDLYCDPVTCHIMFTLSVDMNSPVVQPKYNTTPTEDPLLQCDICHRNKKNVVFNCGHIYCGECSNSVRNNVCPYCREPIKRKQYVYL